MRKFLIKDKYNYFLNNKTIDVDTGEIQVTTESVILQSIALGSCIALVVYDREKKIGGIAHIMLPDKSPTNECNTKYTVDAIDCLLNKIKKIGSTISSLEISVVGGANVLQEGNIPDIIIKSVLEYLRILELEIKNMRVGGIERRSVFLETNSGNVFYTEGNNTAKCLLNI